MAGTAIVVGGGIGGLATAIGLERAAWQVTVLERAEAFRPVGAGLTLAPNAVRAVDCLGLGDQLRARGMAQGAAGIRAASGRWLLREDIGEIQWRFGIPGLMLHRADVHAMLTGVLKHTDARIGHRVTQVRGDEDAATVTFEGRTSTGSATADLVAVADGVHSQLRAALFPKHPGVSYAGYITWRGVVPADAARGIGLGNSLTESWGRGKRFGIVPLLDGRGSTGSSRCRLRRDHTARTASMPRGRVPELAPSDSAAACGHPTRSVAAPRHPFPGRAATQLRVRTGGAAR